MDGSQRNNLNNPEYLFHMARRANGLWTLTDQPGIDLFRAGPAVWCRLRAVYVILFGVGEKDLEGIYSLRANGAEGIPHETIIAFESEEDAQRYAGLLEASMDHLPHVCSIPPRELLGFCSEQLYSCRLEPRGSLLIPPDFNVSVTDWERSLRLRDNQFSVLDSEPELMQLANGQLPRLNGAAGGGVATATATANNSSSSAAAAGLSGSGVQGGGPAAAGSQARGAGVPGQGGTRPTTLARYSGLSGSDLEEIKARLENLLPRE